MKRTKPIPKRACLSSPLEYEISIAMPVVRRRTGFKRLMELGTLPETIITAIVSPKAFAIESVIPEKIPTFADFKDTLNIV